MDIAQQTITPQNAEFTILISKLMPVKEFAESSKDEMVRSLDSVLTDALETLYKNSVRTLIKQHKTKDEICAFLGLASNLFDELYEEIEDDDLIKLVEERVEEAGGWDEMRKDSISWDEMLAELDLTQDDIDNGEDFD
ncbi:MAG: hypothetical protein LBL87_02180 [Ruminococcus sp.]|nr:hypothetical protein [Ruminococcus sp.]